MRNTSVSALLDLNHTIARALFEGKEHPWEVLPGLSDWIRAKGAALPAFVRGSAVVGKNAVVGNSVELKNCVLFDEVQVPHFNYVGDSVLGHRAHMGAGAVTSNVRSDKQNVVVHAQRDLPTGLRKLGAILGDRAEVGCNSVLNPGTVLGRDCIVYPTSCVRGVIPERSIFKNSGAIAPREERM